MRFTADEQETLVYSAAVDEDVSYTGRWTDHVRSVVKSEDKYYRIDWQRGLTEYQEDDFEEDEDWEEVFPFTHVEAIPQTSYYSAEDLKKLSPLSDKLRKEKDALKLVSSLDLSEFARMNEDLIKDALDLVRSLTAFDASDIVRGNASVMNEFLNALLGVSEDE